MHYKRSELTIIFNSSKSLDKKTLAIAQGISNAINKQDIREVRLSNTLFRMALEKLGINPKDIMDKSNPLYQETIKGRDPDIDAAYYMIVNNPALLRCPIALHEDKAVLCNTPTDLLKLS
jgi:arsenate reductase (glutaredoxin)